MPRARSKRDRVHQVANWLRDAFPIHGYQIIVRVEKISLDGKSRLFGKLVESSSDPKVLILSVDPRDGLGVILDTTLHEWAHAKCWNETTVEHSREWGIAYAELLTAWDGGGSKESWEYKYK